MTRGVIPGLRSPTPLIASLPAVYQSSGDSASSVTSNRASRAPAFPVGTFTVTISGANADNRRREDNTLSGEGIWTIVVESDRADHPLNGERLKPAWHLDVWFYLGSQLRGTGVFVVNDDRLEVTSTPGDHEAGTYRWQFSGTALLLDPIDDPSPTRKALLSQSPLFLADFGSRFLSGFDDCLAPIISVIDSIHAYVDPMLAPEDFLEWIARWFQISPPTSWPLKRRRERIHSAFQIFQWWGTAKGIRDYVQAVSGLDADQIEIEESGGAVISGAPGAAFPGDSVPRLVVRLSVRNDESIDLELIKNAVAAAKPAHVLHEVERVSP
jgi:phage tail-like protein